MAKTYRAWEIEQRWLLPPSVLELVPREHPAHFIRELVRQDLDLASILDTYREERGQPPYHPVMMTALLLYAYSQGVHSSRQMAKACVERVDFMAVTARCEPDFRTISDFRKRHLRALQELFVQVLALCSQAGLVRLGHVALDGTKIAANASRHKAMSYGRMCSEEPRLAAEVKAWLDKAASTDDAEDEQYGKDRRGDELPDWVADKQKRVEKIREAKAALERQAKEAAAEAEEQGEHKKSDTPDAKAQRNFTDPESRMMYSHGRFEQAYNCQAAVDAESQIIVAREVVAEQSDMQQLRPLVEQIKSNTGRQAAELSADNGYCSEANLKELSRRHIRGYVATGRQLHRKTFADSPPPRAWGSAIVQAMRRRLRRGGWRSRYRLRKVTVEPVFGQIKGAKRFRQFLLRGLERVKAEWSLVCTGHNLRKLAAAAS
jgi:transposase